MIFFDSFIRYLPPLVYESGIFLFPLNLDLRYLLDVVAVWLLVFYTLILYTPRYVGYMYVGMYTYIPYTLT